jgi:hypothetical protein
MISDWMTTKEAAALLGHHPSWIRKLCAEERLAAKKHAGQWFVHRSCVSEGSVPNSFPYLSVQDACEELGRSPFAVRRKIHLGQIEAVKAPFKCWAITSL